MSILQLIPPKHYILRRKANKISTFDKKLGRLIDDMVETMVDSKGIGLAAPQIGQSVKVIVFGRFDDNDYEESDTLPVTELVNPKIIKASHELVTDLESCLSLPGLTGLVERHKTIVVTGRNRYGKKVRIKTSDETARVIQHEIDHLNGVLFPDIAFKVWSGDELVKDISSIEND